MSNVRVDLMAYLFRRFGGRHAGKIPFDRYWGRYYHGILQAKFAVNDYQSGSC